MREGVISYQSQWISGTNGPNFTDLKPTSMRLSVVKKGV